MNGSDEGYRDHPVRDYVLTGGRGGPSRNTISDVTVLVAKDMPLQVTASRQEHGLMRLCAKPLSVVEASHYLELPVSTVRIIASALVDSGHLHAQSSAPHIGGPSLEVLEQVLAGLHAL